MAAEKTANTVYVKLKDKSTSFHDISQGKNVVSDRIVEMKRTAKVAQALHHKVLVEVEQDEYDAYVSHTPAAKKAAAPPAVPATKKAAAPTKAAKKAVASKKSSLLEDDDEEDDKNKDEEEED